MLREGRQKVKGQRFCCSVRMSKSCKKLENVRLSAAVKRLVTQMRSLAKEDELLHAVDGDGGIESVNVQRWWWWWWWE